MDTETITKEDTDRIDFNGLLRLKRKYWRLLELYPFPKPPVNGEVPEMLSYFKRKSHDCSQIGHYSNISVFEAANRIATDLVIINGAIQLAEANEDIKQGKFTLRLGTRHDPDFGDITIGNSEGEAFNVAPSYLSEKLRKTKSKWFNGGLQYIFINEEVAEKLRDIDGGTQIIKVKNWSKK